MQLDFKYANTEKIFFIARVKENTRRKTPEVFF